MLESGLTLPGQDSSLVGLSFATIYYRVVSYPLSHSHWHGLRYPLFGKFLRTLYLGVALCVIRRYGVEGL